GGDVTTGDLTTVGGLVAGPVGRVEDGLAALDVVQRRHLRVDRGVPEPRRAGGVRPGHQLRVRQHPAAGGRGQAVAGQVDVDVTGDDAVVEVVLVDVEGDLVPVRQRGPVRVGGRVPVRVADQGEPDALPVLLEHVRAGGDHVLLVPDAGVAVPGHRGGGRQLGEEVEPAERLLQVEHDGALVRG